MNRSSCCVLLILLLVHHAPARAQSARESNAPSGSSGALMMPAGFFAEMTAPHEQGVRREQAANLPELSFLKEARRSDGVESASDGRDEPDIASNLAEMGEADPEEPLEGLLDESVLPFRNARPDSIGSTIEAFPAAHRNYRSSNSRSWQIMPDGLLWHSYLAGPHEPRISSVIYYDNNNDSFWDATLGGRVGLIRYGTRGAVRPRGWQWDLEGAVMTRLDMLHAQDVESMDYRFGTEITWAEGQWAMKFGYFHISSHVGDEYLLRNMVDTRTNYVTESWIIGASYNPWDVVRLYGEFANAFRASDGARRYQFQTGAEYMPVLHASWWGAPFAAINLDFRQAVDYDVSTTVQGGWAFRGPTSDRHFRIGLQYFDGPTSQFSFFERRESYLGFGLWFDY